MHELGIRLKTRREELGMTLRDIEQSTKIGLRMLEKMEAGEFEALPAGIFARNFLKQYCAEVEMDPEPFLEALLPANHDEDLEHERDRSPHLKTWGILVFIAAISVIGWLGWHRSWFDWRSPEPETKIDVANVQSLTSQSSAAQPSDLPAAKDEQAPVQFSQSDEGVDLADDIPEALSDDASVVELPGADMEEPTAILRFEVSERCWVHLRCPDRDMDFMLEIGESYVVACGFPIRLTLGNAGAVTLTLNGKPVSFPSESRVLRDFEIQAPDQENTP